MLCMSNIESNIEKGKYCHRVYKGQSIKFISGLFLILMEHQNKVENQEIDVIDYSDSRLDELHVSGRHKGAKAQRHKVFFFSLCASVPALSVSYPTVNRYRAELPHQ